MSSSPAPRVQLLMTGSEIMSGDTVDSNSSLIARRLGELGLGVARKVTLGDDRALLERELAAMTADADVVIINGGLGPTIDDLTAEVVAAVAATGIEEHPEALAHLEHWCRERRLALNDANRKQSRLPRGCVIVPNHTGSAVGFELTIGSCRVFATPGVPGELRAMLDTITQRLAARLDGERVPPVIRLQTFGLGESSAQQYIATRCPDWPADVELGFRAGAPQLELKLSVRSPAATTRQAQCRERLKELFGDHILGENDATLAAVVLEKLQNAGKTLATAESCTGGLIASMLTRVPGASRAFHAGFVTYDNSVKHALLGVSEKTLERHGAVSEPVAREMAQGALERSGADLAIAVTGVAGPEGGTVDKPVGTVWLAWGDDTSLESVCLLWPLERVLFQTMISATALDLMRRRLSGLSSRPRYVERFSCQGRDP